MAKAKGAAAAQRRPRSPRSLGIGRRRHLVEVEVDCASEDNYLFSYLTDGQTLGIFVRSLAPQPSGTLLTLRFLASEPRLPVTDIVNELTERAAAIEASIKASIKAEIEVLEPEPDPLDEPDSLDEPIDSPAMPVPLPERETARGTSRIRKIQAEEPTPLPAIVAVLGEEDGEDLCLDGEVIWVNPYRPSARDNLHPGMGIRLPSLDDRLRARLFALVGRFAYLT